jgi:hypothetical protein
VNTIGPHPPNSDAMHTSSGMKCGECERSAIYVHTAKIEAEHDKMVIQTQAQKIQELEKALKVAEKGNRK